MQHYSFIKDLTPKLFRKEKKQESMDFVTNDSSSKTLHVMEESAHKKHLRKTSEGAALSRKCKRCDQAFPDINFHCCEVYGYSECPAFVPAHFCLTLNKQAPSVSDFTETHQLIMTILLSRYPSLKGSNLSCRSDESHKHCILLGFHSMEAELIHGALAKLKVDERGFAKEYGLKGMEIEYVSGFRFTKSGD
jgi:hypothetical protein